MYKNIKDMIKRSINKNLTFKEVEDILIESSDKNKSYDIYYGYEEIECHLQGYRLVIFDSYSEDVYDKRSKEWSVRLLDKKILEEDKIKFDNISMDDLKEIISILSNKYILRTIWDNFKISNSDTKLKDNIYTFAIRLSEGEDYKPSYVEIEKEIDINSRCYVSDYEENSFNWSIEFIK